MHDVITIGVPVLAILFGILMNQRAIDRLSERIEKLEGKIEARFAHMEGRVDRIQADLAQFYRILGEHGARIENIEKR